VTVSLNFSFYVCIEASYCVFATESNKNASYLYLVCRAAKRVYIKFDSAEFTEVCGHFPVFGKIG
jgi:hypothetical protein